MGTGVFGSQPIGLWLSLLQLRLVSVGLWPDRALAPQLYILYRFVHFVPVWTLSGGGLWPDRVLAPQLYILYRFGPFPVGVKSRSPKTPIGWLPTTFAPGSFFSKCTKRPCQGRIHMFLVADLSPSSGTVFVNKRHGGLRGGCFWRRQARDVGPRGRSCGDPVADLEGRWRKKWAGRGGEWQWAKKTIFRLGQ